ncbi:DCC1-like thiol-disulfide oxidoreductase family protein [Kordiimonas sp. A6E486]|nr:DCC1-like thiol-disulfide oxidoreductase family protein [Kordiimonas marina]
MTKAEDAAPLMLYDGVCNLCNGMVRFILKRDRRALFRFASVQSDYAAQALMRFGKVWEGDTFYLILDGRLYDRSSAALRILARLSFPWPMMAVFLIVPKPLRDWVYGLVAKNRYRLFGRTETCQMPDKSVRDRFLDLKA